MSSRLQGKIAFLTAAGQGIGKASALAFAREGASVIATDIDSKKLRDLDSINEISTCELDVMDTAKVEKFLTDIPPPNIVLNCAGYVHQGTILECNYDQWDYSFELNVRSQFVIIKNLLPRIIKNNGASIINISSVASSIKGIINRCAYGASKAAVIGMTKALAADFVKQNVRVNAICPGTVDTPSLEDRMRQIGDIEKARKDFIARQPMGRLGQPEEIAEAAVYLASDEAKFVTGQTIIIDGGITI
ncbi:MAG: NAD(P)-dependent oxidoreductase [Proteobacteria bacterium]|nr:NAD(P)-dependent oxidoreductase [Pseudomonadota bacterium]